MSYRHLPVTKRVGGKTKRYKNLAAFFAECRKFGTSAGNACMLTNMRCLKDGGGLATVKTIAGPFRAGPAGTWLLHFNSCEIMKDKLSGRVEGPRGGRALDGSRRRRR